MTKMAFLNAPVTPPALNYLSHYYRSKIVNKLIVNHVKNEAHWKNSLLVRTIFGHP